MHIIRLTSTAAHCILVLLVSFVLSACLWPEEDSARFEITFPLELADSLHGRLLVMLSVDSIVEPRFQITDGLNTQQVFGHNVEHWPAGETLAVPVDAFGYPVRSQSTLPGGTYWVQALINRYEYFERGDGHRVLLPPDKGEGQQWQSKPGNLYSKPKKISWVRSSRSPITLALTEEIPLLPEPVETEHIKYVRMKSALLSAFWGRDIELGAHVLLPYGWHDRPNARYPLAIFHGHFPTEFGGWRTVPPDDDLEPDYSTRFGIHGYNRIQQQEAYDFYRLWMGPNFPRVLAIEIQHPTPYYDDSYAVNSENNGPYGDALTYELIPYIEQQFRGIGEGWARFTYGGSTGGWEALAVQLFYPEQYNGCYAACPDPIDFRAYCLVNIYEDENAYHRQGPFKKLATPGHRNHLGQISTTVADMNHRELALGTHSRSGQQWDIWQAVYSPVGPDGYPKPIWDKETGQIDRDVAHYWRENYDLTHIMQRDWPKYGHLWQGKIHLYCGDMDNYYLNNAVYLAEDVLRKVDPPFLGEVEYGDRAEHCWNGDHTQPNYITRLRYHRMFIPKWAEQVKNRAPRGADLSSWRY